MEEEPTPEQMAQRIRNLLRGVEVKKATFDRSTLWEVFTTNTDLEAIKVVHQGYHKDIAVTVMFNQFINSQCMVDFMLVPHSGNSDHILCLSDRSKRARGETQ
jgi:hypothetical protein